MWDWLLKFGLAIMPFFVMWAIWATSSIFDLSSKSTALEVQAVASTADRVSLHAEARSTSDTLSALKQDSALKQQDIAYIKQTVTEIKETLKQK